MFQEYCTPFKLCTLFSFGFSRFYYSYPSGLLHWRDGNRIMTQRQWNSTEGCTCIYPINMIYTFRLPDTEQNYRPNRMPWVIASQILTVSAQVDSYSSSTTMLQPIYHMKGGGFAADWGSEVVSLVVYRCSFVWLTHWGRDKMTAISQTNFSNAFSSTKNFVFWFEFHWNLFLRVQLTKSQHWFR